MSYLIHQLSRRKYGLVLVPIVVVAAFLLAQRLSGTPNHPDTNVVAAYSDGVITKEQILAHYQMVQPQDQPALRSLAGLRYLVQDLAVHAVVERWAEERQVDTKESFRRAMKSAAEAVTVNDVVERMHKFDVKVEEGEIQKYFDEHRAQYQGKSLTEVKEQIRGVLHGEKEQAVIDVFLKDLRANAGITSNPELLDVPSPTEAELQAYYQANADGLRQPDQVRVDEIRVAAKEKADRALARIQAGEGFAQVALETSDPSSPSPTEFIARGARGAGFDANVFVLDTGQISKVFQDGDAYAVVRVADKRSGRLPSLDEMRDQIAEKLRAEREAAHYVEKKNESLFSIDGVRFTLGDFLDEYNALPAAVRTLFGTREGKRDLVERIIDRLLILQSVPAKLAQSKNQKEIEETRQHVLAQILHQEEMGGKLEVSDQEIEQHYRKNGSHYATPAKAKISYIRIARGADDASRTAEQAKVDAAYGRVRPLLPWRPGEDFAAVAREVSEDPDTAQNGGALDRWIEHDHAAGLMSLDSALFLENVFSLKPGEISPIIPLTDSYYIVLMREKVEPQPLPLEQVKDLVRSDVSAEKHQQALREFEQELVGRMGLAVHEDRLKLVLAELETP